MKIKNSKVFRKFLLSYIVILLFPIILSGLIYNKAIRIFEKHAIESSESSIDYMVTMIDREMESIDRSVLELSIKPELQRIINLPSPEVGSADMYWFYDFYRLYNNINDKSRNNLMYLMIDTNKTVFGDSFTSFDFSEFYQNYFNYKDLDYTDWYDVYFNSFHYRDFLPANIVYINGKPRNYITALYTIPISKNNIQENRGQGVIAYLYDLQNLEALMNKIVDEFQGNVFVVDKNNQVIASTETKTNLMEQYLEQEKVEEHQGTFNLSDEKKEELIVVHSESELVGLRIIVMIPKSAVEAELLNFRNISLVLFAILLLLGMMIALYLSYRQVKPIRNLIDLIPDLEGDAFLKKTNEIKVLETSIKNITTDITKLKSAVSGQHNRLQVIYLERLLRGNIQSREDLEILTKYVSISPDAHYVVMLVKLSAINLVVNSEMAKEQDLYRVVLDEVLQMAIGEKGYIHILDQNEMAVLLELLDNTDYESYIFKVISDVRKAFSSNLTMRPFFSIGEVCDDLLDVHFSMKEATYAAEVLMNSGNHETIVFYKHLSHEFKDYFYTDEVEQRVINLTKSGNIVELRNVLKKIYLNTIHNKHSKVQLNRLIMNELYASLVKMSIEFDYELDIITLDKISKKSATEDFYEALVEHFEQLCQFMSSRKKCHNERLMNDVLDYINTEFTNCDLSLNKIASQFNLSESYFSQFFKENKLENFSRYLEDIRIRYASKLLLETNNTMEKIAELSGYNNSNTFRRAFRRVNGLSPTAYVEANQKN